MWSAPHGAYTMSVPAYVEGKDLTRYADKHGIKNNTLVRSKWDKATYQAVAVTETYVAFDNGEKHTHRDLANSVENGTIEVIGQRSTR